MDITKLRLGDILIGSGAISHQQLEMAIVIQNQTPNQRLGEILLDQSFISEDQLLNALSQRLEMPYIDFNSFPIELSAVELIPKQISTKYCILAVSSNSNRVTLAVNDPLDFHAIEDVKSLINSQCVICVAQKQQILNAISKYYSEIDAKNAVAAANDGMTFGKSSSSNELEVNSNLAPIINLLNSVILKAYTDEASDIHFEPFEHHINVRLRIDGQLIEYQRLDVSLMQHISTRLKILSDMDIAERRVPQDGHFKVKIGNNDVGIRVSTIPTVYGEKLVLRFLSRNIKLDNNDMFGMNEDNYRKISRILQNPYGIVYITGPTGSGKTTTLYMMIEKLSKNPINISTIEDPVERNIEGVNQVQVNVLAGLTFESGLRSMLRQDPDVILLGETRDRQTASIAISAAVTGHLVLSTLHTNDAISSIVRLSDMGIENYMLANSLVGVVAQRLVKKICPFCKIEYFPSEEEKELILNATMLYKGKGCHNCNYTGYKGRIAIHEILELDSEIRRMISSNAPTESIYKHVREKNTMIFIRDNLLNLVHNGTTSIDELKRHTSFDV